jgi:Trk K+ transport system NAD-binding subunit
MSNVVALVLRRMRAPLLVLIVAYTVSIVGLMAMPGVDDQGDPWRMDFFHAFYFVSYTASTIGFGEIPHTFTGAQRLWTIVTVYITVIAWLYAIGTLLTLLQDRAFQHALTESRFARQIRNLDEPFYLICGYGGTGSLLVHGLTERGLAAVVVDIRGERIDALRLAEHVLYVPGLEGDAGVSRHLLEAGLQHPQCAGVVALTDRDHTNLQIAITAKLLNPDIPVICRAETQDVVKNMKSFGTEHTVNPFEAFADHLAMAIHSPSLYAVHERLTGVPGTPVGVFIYPPRGRWVLCGYGRFGKAVRRELDAEGIASVVVEADPERTACESCVVGRGTEADTLAEAGVEDAVGIVAGTDDDANNLSILMTAREMNPDLFFVVRQNKRYNDPIFEAVHADLVMQRSHIIAREILALITTPLLSRFLARVRGQDPEWVAGLLTRLEGILEPVVPDIWTVTVSTEESPAVCQVLHESTAVHLGDLLLEPRDRERHLAAVALMLCRDGQDHLLPDERTPLHPGDEILFCGRWEVHTRMLWTLRNLNAISYVVTGEDRPAGLVWRWLARRGA